MTEVCFFAAGHKEEEGKKIARKKISLFLIHLGIIYTVPFILSCFAYAQQGQHSRLSTRKE